MLNIGHLELLKEWAKMVPYLVPKEGYSAQFWTLYEDTKQTIKEAKHEKK